MRASLVVWVPALLAAGCAAHATPRSVVDDAAAALGGKSRILASRTLVIEGRGETYSFGQSVSPGGALPVVDVPAFRRAIDLAAGRWRQRQTQARRPPSPNTVPVTFSFGVDGAIAYLIDDEGASARRAAAEAAERRAELHHHPLELLRAALAPGARLTNAREAAGRASVDVATADGTFTLAIDQRTKLPASITSPAYDPVLGDVAIETTFDGYQDAGGLKLPTRIAARRDRDVIAALEVSRNVVDDALDDVAAPSDLPAPAAPAVAVTAEPLADGVWLLGGQSHHSVLIELADRALLVEAPLDEARTRAVIAKARELVAAKPLTHAIMSHHHHDHSGGIRTAIAEGLTIVAHDAAKAFVEDLAARRHTIAKDALAAQPRPLALETVTGERVFGDGRTVRLYPIEGNVHAATLLMVYVPHARILITADLFDRSSTGKFPFAANLVDNVRRRSLDVERLVGLHGRPVAFADVIAAAAQQP
jgi:glyoxylase-like metal-dependent hydrolase (beta-lactamase superfamily II)